MPLNQGRETVRHTKDRFHRRRSILRTIHRLSRERGDKREEKVTQAMELLKERGYIIQHGSYPHNSYQDRKKKADKWLITFEGKWIEFQVKGTAAAAERHLAQHPHMPVICAETHEKIEDIVKQIIAAFNLESPC